MCVRVLATQSIGGHNPLLCTHSIVSFHPTEMDSSQFDNAIALDNWEKKGLPQLSLTELGRIQPPYGRTWEKK